MHVYILDIRKIFNRKKKRTLLCPLSEDYMPLDYSRIRGFVGFHGPLESKVHRKRLTLLGTCCVALLSMRNSKEALHKPSCEIKTFIIRTLIDQSCRMLLTVPEWGASTRSCILLKPKKLLGKVSRKYRPSIFFYICRYIIYTSAPRMFQATYTL